MRWACHFKGKNTMVRFRKCRVHKANKMLSLDFSKDEVMRTNSCLNLLVVFRLASTEIFTGRFMDNCIN
jgi:hypothetical protein